MRAIIADTGPLYAAIDSDDQYHQRARTDLNQIETDNLDLRNRVFRIFPVSCGARGAIALALNGKVISGWGQDSLFWQRFDIPIIINDCSLCSVRSRWLIIKLVQV